MSGLITGIVLDRYPGRGGERLVAVALADNAHRDGTRIFPSIAELADRTRLSERSVQLHISRMVAAGWLILTKKSTGRRGATNEYRICPDWLAGGNCTPPAAPVLRTNAPKKAKSWGANSSPHEAVDKSHSWGEAGCAVGCNLTQDGVKPIAPKPSLTVKEPNTPLPPTGGREPGQAEQTDEALPPDADDFTANFWSLYPRKVDEQLARAAWAELAPSPDLQRTIKAAVIAWSASDEWKRERRRFVPKPNRWLARERWKDVPGEADAPPVVDEAERTRAALAARDAEPPADPAKARQLAEECRNRLGLRQRRAGQVAEGVAA